MPAPKKVARRRPNHAGILLSGCSVASRGAEGGIERPANQGDGGGGGHIPRHSSRHFSSRRAWCWPAVFARWPAIVIVALHTKGGGPPVSVATMIGENTMSVSVSGGHGVLAVCESSGSVYCRLAAAVSQGWPPEFVGSVQL